MGCLKLTYTEENNTTLKVVYRAVNTSVLKEQEKKHNYDFLEVGYRSDNTGGMTNTILEGTQYWRPESGKWTSGDHWVMPSNAISNGGSLSDGMNKIHTNGISWVINNPNQPSVANPGGRTTTTILQPVRMYEKDFNVLFQAKNLNPNFSYFRFTTGFDTNGNFTYQYGYLPGILRNWPQ